MNVAMISYWHVHSREYAEKLKENKDVNIVAVWDYDAEIGKKWAEELNCEFIPDYDELLKRKDIDAIAMVAKTVDHKDMLCKAANAKKHIFTEKVLATTSKEAYEIRDAVLKNNVKFTISYPHQCTAELQFTKKMIESGDLGTITYARVRKSHDGTSAGWLPDHFYDEKQCGGGAMMDLGAHPMYLLHWLIGKPKNMQSCFTSAFGKGVEDNAVTVMEFENGAIGVSETGFASKNYPFVVELSGTKGSLFVRDNVVSYANEKTDNKWVVVDNLDCAIKDPITQWVDSIVKDEESCLGINEAVALSEFMDCAYRAYKSGKKENY